MTAVSALLAPGQLPEDRVDNAVRRILMLKAGLGLFDQPYVPEDEEITEPTRAARALVRAAAARSTVLLKNDGTLPVTPSGRVLLTGPYATSTDHLGAWTQSFAAPASSIADELTGRYPLVEFTVEPGVGFYDDDPANLETVAAAAASHDLVLVFAGEPSGLSGEAASRSDLRLPGRQEELIRTVAATGVPFVVVLENGRPLVTSGWIDVAPAVLEAWHLGTEAAAAIVDVLTGAAEPSGRLPMSFPRSAGQVPIYYAHENTGRPATTGGTMRAETVDIGLAGPDNVTEKYTSKYLDLDLGPQFDFGHGGGYTTFRHHERAAVRSPASRWRPSNERRAGEGECRRHEYRWPRRRRGRPALRSRPRILGGPADPAPGRVRSPSYRRSARRSPSASGSAWSSLASGTPRRIRPGLPSSLARSASTWAAACTLRMS